MCLRSENRAAWRAQSNDDRCCLCYVFRVSDAGCCAYADGEGFEPETARRTAERPGWTDSGQTADLSEVSERKNLSDHRSGFSNAAPGNASGFDDNPKLTLHALAESGTVYSVVAVAAVGVEELRRACTQNLETVVEFVAGSQVFCAEARARVIHLDEGDRLGGVVDDGGRDVSGVAACGDGEGKRQGRD